MVRKHQGDAPSSLQAGRAARIVAHGASDALAAFSEDAARRSAALRAALGGRNLRRFLADVLTEPPGAKVGAAGVATAAAVGTGVSGTGRVYWAAGAAPAAAAAAPPAAPAAAPAAAAAAAAAPLTR